MGLHLRMRSTAAFCSGVYLRSWLPWLCSRLRAADGASLPASAPEAVALGMAAAFVFIGMAGCAGVAGWLRGGGWGGRSRAGCSRRMGWFLGNARQGLDLKCMDAGYS